MTRPDGDLGRSVAVQVAGMTLPLLIVGVMGVKSVGWVSARVAIPVLAVGFTGISWGLLDRYGIDEVDFLLGSILGPVLVFFGLVIVNATLWQLINFYPALGLMDPAAYWYNVIGVFAPHNRGQFAFVGAYALAGFTAVFLHRRAGFRVVSE